MRIKIIGDNNCARATRHLLRLAGFAVTEFLPADALTSGPHAGYAITVDLAPAVHSPDARHGSPSATTDDGGKSSVGPDPAAHHHASVGEEAPQAHPVHRGASSPAFVRPSARRPTAGALVEGAEQPASAGHIHFDSVESALEAAVLRHVTQLAAAPVIVDRPGGVVHSDRELRIIAPNTGDAKADEAAAVAIEFGVLRGLLDLSAPSSGAASKSKNVAGGTDRGTSAEAPANSRSEGGKKKWWPFGILLMCGALGFLRARAAAPPPTTKGDMVPFAELRVNKPVLLADAAPAADPPQGQFATGQGLKITDGANFLVVDPCKAQTKAYASINQTANAQLVAGTTSKKIYVCSIHVVVAAATNVAVVEGTGSVCGTGTAGVSGFGGATAATGWNFAANAGIALGNGDSSLGAEGTSGDNLCIFNSGSGQVSGGISYVVQ